MPIISVVMSTYNTKEEYLRESIESILNQTFTDFEFIIIDDGSTANDCKIIESYYDSRIKVIKNDTNRGLAYSLNRGIEQASGKYLMRMDSDDIALPFRMQEQYNYMESHVDTDILCGLAWMFGGKSGILGTKAVPDEFDMMLFFNNRIIHPSVMIRKDFLDKHALRYDENFKRSQDYEMWTRAVTLGKISLQPLVVLKYRVHKNQATTALSDDQRRMGYFVYKRMLSSLNIDLSEDQHNLHFALFNAKVADSATALIEWANKLRAENKKSGRFDCAKFNAELNYRLIINLLGNIIRRKYRLSLKMIRTMFSPIRLYGALRQACKYRRLTFKANRNNKRIVLSLTPQ